MKKQTKKHATYFIAAIVATLVAIVTLRFLIVTAKYLNYSDELGAIESSAIAGTLTQNGFQHWTEDLVQMYENTLENKLEFIESSDFAAYLYYSGFSKTGQVIRFLAIIGNIVLLCWSISYLFRYIKYLIKHFIRYLKRLFYRPKQIQHRR